MVPDRIPSPIEREIWLTNITEILIPMVILILKKITLKVFKGGTVRDE